MAFTYCTNCGEKIDMENERCPYCGHAREGHSYGRETYSRENTEQGAFYEERGSFDGDSRGYGQRDQGFGQRDQDFGQRDQGFGQGGFGYGNHRGAPLYRTPGSMRPRRPISVGLTVFSIINIIFSCCAFPSLIFGILALVNTAKAQNAESEEQEIAKKKIALVLNVVGLVLTLLSIMAFSVVFVETLAQYVANGGI
jgi:hypothetical protein